MASFTHQPIHATIKALKLKEIICFLKLNAIFQWFRCSFVLQDTSHMQLKEEKLSTTGTDSICTANEWDPFSPSIKGPSLIFLFLKHNWYSQQAATLLSSLAPDDKQTVRDHPAKRSLAEQLLVLCGSDLINCAWPWLRPTIFCACCLLGSHRLRSWGLFPTSTVACFSVLQGILTSQIRWTVLWVLAFMRLIYLYPFPSTRRFSDSFLSSFPSNALQGITRHKVVSTPSHHSTSTPIKQNKNAL